MKKWECIVCGWIYDEEKGWPEDGIAAGTRWEDVPEDWLCPDCGVGKQDFEMVEVAGAASPAAAPIVAAAVATATTQVGTTPKAVSSPTAVSGDFRVWECIVCGWLYDEAKGWPEDGIAAGTRWEDVPVDWLCPDCGVGKEDFEMIEI